MGQFLKTKKGKIVAPNNKPVYLHGVNLGGWLMMEAYILHAPNLPVKDLKKQMQKSVGRKGVVEFEEKFRKNWIKEADLKNIKRLGLNCVRVPFHHNLIEKKAYQYDEKGVGYLDRVVRWAKKYGIWVILDLHAACGSQNHDWHSDSYGRAQLWKNKNYQKRIYALWEFLADRYKDEPQIAGYDLLNEAVIHNTKLLNRFYKNVIRSIRSVDKNHILFVEGNKWAQDIGCLDCFKDDNYVLSVHHYEPLDFTFNFVPYLRYPLDVRTHKWDKHVTRRILKKYKKIADRHGVPVFVGEFGVNYRMGLFDEDKWLKEVLDCFDEFGFHWTYWTYKAIKNSCFPDGLYSYYDNPRWVNREGPKTGWNTFPEQWPKNKGKMAWSWRTDKFRENTKVIQVLKKYA